MTIARRAKRALAGVTAHGAASLRTRGWAPTSRLFVVGDRGGWSIDDDALHVAEVARSLGYEVAPPEWAPYVQGQAVFVPSHFTALRPRWLGSTHRLGFAYFHGRPGTPGHPEFDEALATLRESTSRVDRVQVTHTEMHELVVAAGVGASRVFRIPIGIDIERFPLGDERVREAVRRTLGLAEGAFVVGSFQKDGVGWGDGLEPKLVKGPDALVAALRLAHERIPELVVLLTGPARGYVRAELRRHGIPAVHTQVRSRDRLASVYHALDAYLVASRQEGGPKSALEALATGVSLVSTRVGQTPEIVEDGRAALFADVDDTEALASLLVRVHGDDSLRRTLRENGRLIAEAHTYQRLEPRWAELLEGFVDRER